MEHQQADYSYDDFRDMFKVALASIIHRQGIQMASDDHFASAANNAGGVARAAARYLAAERAKHATIEPPKAAKGVKV